MKEMGGKELPLEIGTRRELFVDDRLVGELWGGASLRLRFALSDDDLYSFRFAPAGPREG